MAWESDPRNLSGYAIQPTLNKDGSWTYNSELISVNAYEVASKFGGEFWYFVDDQLARLTATLGYWEGPTQVYNINIRPDFFKAVATEGVVKSDGTGTYVRSKDRNAFPDDDLKDGVYYYYIGLK